MGVVTIEEYLPQPLTTPEVEAAIAQVIMTLGATSLKDLGKVMAVAMVQLKGKADGKQVQGIVKSQLECLAQTTATG
ncbi:GatB/YqeY domain-containing protein [Neosynechococcus sphagnicola]|uniref:GatB/YqeY domain-containing protein n=1 Tax=Neosynechococcus sphagnicola TaxID=1501145 RepID=UPI000691BE61|nr:GatB/YqeY domain-containing protein [Neosynechococcus sphagnicola]